MRHKGSRLLRLWLDLSERLLSLGPVAPIDGQPVAGLHVSDAVTDGSIEAPGVQRCLRV